MTIKCRPIAELRTLCNMSQRQAAYLLNVSIRKWKHLENNRIEMSDQMWAEFSKHANAFKIAMSSKAVKGTMQERSELIFEQTKKALLDGVFDFARFCQQHGFSQSTVRKLLYTMRDNQLVESEICREKGRNKFTVWHVVDRQGLEDLCHHKSKDTIFDDSKELFELWGIRYTQIPLPAKIHKSAISDDELEDA